MRLVANALLALLLAALATAHAQDGPVSGQEIVEKWSGKELSGTSASGTKAYTTFGAGGKISISAGGFSDTGTWRPWEGGNCATWVTIRAGQERCFTVTRSGSTYKVTNPDGSLVGYFTGMR